MNGDNTPSTTANHTGGPLYEPRKRWRARIKQTDEQLRNDISTFERLADFGGWIVVLGVVMEAAFSVKNLSEVVPDIAVAAGVAAEILFARKAARCAEELQRRSDVLISKANERAALSDLKRSELELRLQPRMTDQRQFDLIQTLRGKLSEITIAHELDAETGWFADSLRDAFFNAGIRVAMYPRSANVHSFGMLIYDPEMKGAKMSATGNVLVDIFRNTGTALAMINGLPTDVPASPEYPALIIGGRFLIPPSHLVPTLA